MLAGHDDATVLVAVVGPAKGDDVGLAGKVNIEGVIPDGANVTYTVKDFRA